MKSLAKKGSGIKKQGSRANQSDGSKVVSKANQKSSMN